MIKKISLAVIMLLAFSCTELQQVVNQLPGPSTGLSNEFIANGLKEALDQGLKKQVSKLTQTDGFYKNELVKILLPEELRKVDQTLRDIGMGNLADEGLKVLNRAAENAVSEATPIFVNAVREMSFTDARNILFGDNNAATTYLENKTSVALYSKFNPIINDSFKKVGADKIWSSIITRYNAIPLTNNVNPDLTDYVTQEALSGVYKMTALEEEQIRTKLASRTTEVLRKVFALQD